MSRLIGKDIRQTTVIVECAEKAEILPAIVQYGKVGIALKSYDEAIEREADRLLNRPSDPPEYHF